MRRKTQGRVRVSLRDVSSRSARGQDSSVHKCVDVQYPVKGLGSRVQVYAAVSRYSHTNPLLNCRYRFQFLRWKRVRDRACAGARARETSFIHRESRLVYTGMLMHSSARKRVQVRGREGEWIERRRPCAVGR